MLKLVIPISEKGGDLEIHEGTQMNLYNAFCAPFEHFGLASSLSKSRRVQSLELTKNGDFLKKF